MQGVLLPILNKTVAFGGFMIFFQALEGLFSIVLMVSIGYFLTAKKYFTQENAGLLPVLVNFVAVPTYMIWSLLSTFDREKLLPLLSGVLVPAIAMIISYCVGFLLSNMVGLPQNRKGTFRSAFFCSSAIFVGVPVNMALFGDSSIPYVLIYFLANAFLFWTIGNYSISLDGKTAPAKLISIASVKKVFSFNFLAIISLFSEINQPSSAFYNINFPVVKNSNTCRIITSVLQLCKSIKQNRSCLLITNVTYYTTHTKLPLYLCS